jgi:hypothetical protein
MARVECLVIALMLASLAGCNASIEPPSPISMDRNEAHVEMMQTKSLVRDLGPDRRTCLFSGVMCNQRLDAQISPHFLTVHFADATVALPCEMLPATQPSIVDAIIISARDQFAAAIIAAFPRLLDSLPYATESTAAVARQLVNKPTVKFRLRVQPLGIYDGQLTIKPQGRALLAGWLKRCERDPAE